MKNSAAAWIALSLVVMTGLAHAQVSQEVRCSTDSLSVTQAIERLEWARRCALKRVASSTKFYTTIPHVGSFPEYAENMTSTKHFVGSSYNVRDNSGAMHPYAINTAYQQSRYSYGSADGTMDILLNGQTYSIWLPDPMDNEKPQPQYPAFGTDPNPDFGEQVWPSANPSDCNLYTAASTIVTTHYVTGYCTASCYTPDQKVLFASGNDWEPGPARGGRYVPILDAFERLLPRVMTLTPSSTLETFSLRPNSVYSYTTELWDSDHKIFEVQTARGSLRLTTEHPVLRSDGRIVFAKDLKVGDELIRVDGTFEPILQIDVTVHHGKVYNLRPTSPDLLENILVAQDFLVGSSQYQNDYVTYINRVILSHSVPTSILPTHVAGTHRQ